MSDTLETYEVICNPRFDKIEEKLEHMDDGIQKVIQDHEIRLDRIEQKANTICRLFWIILVAVVSHITMEVTDRYLDHRDKDSGKTYTIAKKEKGSD